MNLFLVAFGGAIGSVLRYLAGEWIAQLAGRAIWGTLVVNVTGCFLIGLVAEAARSNPTLRHLVMIGALGGYTTFSAFSLQTLELMQARETALALANIALSIILCLLGVWLGATAARSLS